MNENALELFLENYNNKGLCDGLANKMKVIEKEFKKSGITKHINYLPWAVVERIFRLQGGKIEVLDWKKEITFPSQEYNAETGEIEKGTQSAYFMHLKGTWQGEELEEYYPIFDNQTSKVIKTPDAQQLNTSRQRGSVRLIARLSGIGLWIFEQQDDQFDEDGGEAGGEKIKPINKKEEQKESATSKKANKVESKKQEKEIAKQQKDNAMLDVLGGAFGDSEEESLFPSHEPNKKESNEEENINVMDVFKGSIIKGDKEEQPTFKKVEEPKIKEVKDYPKGTEQHSDLLLKVKGYVKTQKDVILAFRNSKGKELLQDLTYSELLELVEELESLEKK